MSTVVHKTRLILLKIDILLPIKFNRDKLKTFLLLRFE